MMWLLWWHGGFFFFEYLKSTHCVNCFLRLLRHEHGEIKLQTLHQDCAVVFENNELHLKMKTEIGVPFHKTGLNMYVCVWERERGRWWCLCLVLRSECSVMYTLLLHQRSGHDALWAHAYSASFSTANHDSWKKSEVFSHLGLLK